MPIDNRSYSRQVGESLKPEQVAQARHHSYVLLSQLYLGGITAVRLPTIQAVPALAECLPQSFDLDEAAAEHYQLFGFNLHPYESIFLSSSGLLGGEIANSVARSYQQIGFEIELAANSPDHIGQELAALAFLCRAEATAWADGSDTVINQMRRRQRAFLEAHLLRWLLPFVLALKQQGHDFYTAVANLTLSLVADHYADLTSDTQSIPSLEITLPSPPDLLDNDKTGLKEIAHLLVTPPFSGLYLGRDDVGRLARETRLPRGFGDRQQMMHNLLRTAVQYDQFSSLLNDLVTMAKAWQLAYRQALSEMPEMAVFTAVWKKQARHTLNLLNQIQGEAESAS